MDDYEDKKMWRAMLSKPLQDHLVEHIERGSVVKICAAPGAIREINGVPIINRGCSYCGTYYVTRTKEDRCVNCGAVV